MSGRQAPLWLRLVVGVYGALSRLLPAGFRRRYGGELAAAFEALVDRARARGVWVVWGVVVRSLSDLAVRIPAEWWAEWRRSGGGARTGAARGGRAGGDRMRDWMQELRWASRSLGRRPLFTVVAVLTLALGIGANVAIFSVVNAVLLRPLPYPESDDIVVITHHAPGIDLPVLENSTGTLRLYRELARSFSHLAAVHERRRNLTGGEEPARVQVVEATPSFFDVVRTYPVLGRAFGPADAEEGAPPVMVLTHEGWATRFGGRADIIGQRVELGGESTEIVGVMPAGFHYPDPETVALLPMYVDPAGEFGTFGLAGLARLAPGVDLEAARTEAGSLQPRLAELYPDLTPEFFERVDWGVSVDRLRDRIISARGPLGITGDLRTALWVVLGTVGFVLLIACANVANLFLARAESRQREVAVRAALGASRRRLAGSFLSESLLLGLGGGVVGVALAYAGVQLLLARAPELPRLHEVGVDGASLAFGALLSVFAALLFGSIPVVRYLGRSFGALLREGRGATGDPSRDRGRKVLIMAQVALALVLLVGSGLMLRSFWQLRAVDPGFDPEGVLTVGISLGDVTDMDRAASFYQQVLDRVTALPGVERVGATNALPIRPSGLNGSSFEIESSPTAEDALPPVSMYATASEGFFEALRIPLLEGRALERADHEGGRPVVVVSEGFARRFLDGDAVGERVRFGDEAEWLEIVGVVGEVRMFGLSDEIRPMAYMPLNTPNRSVARDVMQLVVRARGEPAAGLPAIRAAVREIDPTVPLTTAQPMEAIVAESMVETSFTMLLLGIAAAVAVLLGAIGLYGVISYVVSQRTREIGVRIALGAHGADVRRMVVRQGLRVAVAGILLGLLAALALTRLMDALLFEVSATDPITFTTVILLLSGVSAAASYLPARRASLIRPIEALREE